MANLDAAFAFLSEEAQGKAGTYFTWWPRKITRVTLNPWPRILTDLYVPTAIERIPAPTAIVFLREYVMKNRPVIITGA